MIGLIREEHDPELDAAMKSAIKTMRRSLDEYQAAALVVVRKDPEGAGSAKAFHYVAGADKSTMLTILHTELGSLAAIVEGALGDEDG